MRKISLQTVVVILLMSIGLFAQDLKKVKVDKVGGREALLQVVRVREALLENPLEKTRFEAYYNLWEQGAEHCLSQDLDVLIKRAEMDDWIRSDIALRKVMVSVPMVGKLDVEADVQFSQKASIHREFKTYHVYTTFLNEGGVWKLIAITETPVKSVDSILTIK